MSCGTTQCVKEEMYTNFGLHEERKRVIQLKFQKNKTIRAYFFFYFIYGYFYNFKIFYIFIFFKIIMIDDG